MSPVKTHTEFYLPEHSVIASGPSSGVKPGTRIITDGDYVTDLQEILHDLQYLRKEPNGSFDVETEKAVAEFQSEHRDPQDQEVDLDDPEKDEDRIFDDQGRVMLGTRGGGTPYDGIVGRRTVRALNAALRSEARLLADNLLEYRGTTLSVGRNPREYTIYVQSEDEIEHFVRDEAKRIITVILDLLPEPPESQQGKRALVGLVGESCTVIKDHVVKKSLERFASEVAEEVMERILIYKAAYDITHYLYENVIKENERQIGYNVGISSNFIPAFILKLEELTRGASGRTISGTPDENSFFASLGRSWADEIWTNLPDNGDRYTLRVLMRSNYYLNQGNRGRNMPELRGFSIREELSDALRERFTSTMAHPVDTPPEEDSSTSSP